MQELLTKFFFSQIVFFLLAQIFTYSTAKGMIKMARKKSKDCKPIVFQPLFILSLISTAIVCCFVFKYSVLVARALIGGVLFDYGFNPPYSDTSILEKFISFGLEFVITFIPMFLYAGILTLFIPKKCKNRLHFFSFKDFVLIAWVVPTLFWTTLFPLVYRYFM